MSWFFIGFGYALGSISFSTLIAKKTAGIDIRDHGSKNAGATNTLRVLGFGPALLVLALDVMKGIIPVVLTIALLEDPLWAVLAGIASILGHNWPIFFKFKGGKGVATTIGVVAVLGFWPAAISGVIALIVVAISRYVSLGSLLFVTLLPFMYWLFNLPTSIIAGSVAITALSYYKHRLNVKRLIKGEENKIGGSI